MRRSNFKRTRAFALASTGRGIRERSQRTCARVAPGAVACRDPNSVYIRCAQGPSCFFGENTGIQA